MYPEEESKEKVLESYYSVVKFVFFVKEHYKIVGIAFVCVGLLVFYLYRLFNQKLLVCEQAQVSIVDVYDETSPSVISIDVSGAVANPGVFELANGSRIYDVLELAGPITNEASVVWVSQIINLAQPLHDGQKIYIPFEHDLRNDGLQEVLLTLKDNYQSSSSASSSSLTPTSETPPQVETSSLINVNTASQSQLDELPGVGQAYAEKILANRPYKDVAELISKTKISSKTVENFKHLISF